MNWLILAVLLLAVGGGAFLAVRSPSFIPALIKALLPDILRLAKPKDFTPEQRAVIREGGDPNDQRAVREKTAPKAVIKGLKPTSKPLKK